MKDGFLRVACATPELKVADCTHNAARIVALARQAAEAGASLVVFPELCVTAYTCADLFLSQTLLDAAEQALRDILSSTQALDAVLTVGLPVRWGAALYNCAAVLCHGEILGLVPKTHLPNYGEFQEQRYFTPGPDLMQIEYAGFSCVMGTRQLFCCRQLPAFTLGVEICEDLWVTQPPSGPLALAGATVIANLSASDEVVGKGGYRRTLVCGQSARAVCAYAYADAGEGESTTDLVFAGHNLLYEDGVKLAESQPHTTGFILADVDLERLLAERRRLNTFEPAPSDYRVTAFSLPLRPLQLLRPISPTPFVPQDIQDLAGRCEEILAIQAAGLAGRLRHTRARCAVVGLSGGLDSTLALIVLVHAFDRLKLDRSGILAVTMPGFGTTSRTHSNAEKLARAYGVSFLEVPIGPAVSQHFLDIGQDADNHDVTFENAQARERTQVLMDLANQRGGLVVGTGDLSELALGWATYNGDHMSMYGVNASIPKTLVRHLTAYEAQHSGAPLREVLKDVLATPVSPELLPPKDGKITQRTEEIVGPYELHDFFLYYLLRYGFSPRRIYRLALAAFDGSYDNQVIKRWLCVFLRRFFSQQFKRSCLPDGPKVGSVTLSPRGDWRMPSDACADAWLKEAEALP